VTTRITQRTRTNGWQSSFAASSASTFSVRTDDPSQSVTMAPMPALMLAFGGKSGFQALPTRPLWPQRPPPTPSSTENTAPDPIPESSGTESASDSSPADLPAETAASDAATENSEPEAAAAYTPRSRNSRHLRLLDHAEPPPAGEEQEAAPAPEPEAAAPPAEPEPAETQPAEPEEEAKPAHPHRLEMTIDSLPHHELTEPIPIHIDPLGDTVFTATVSNLDISATGNSIGEALVLLKEQIEFVYGDLNRRSNRSNDQKTALQMLHTYIAASGNKPSWL
jgi:hypothetical protein